MCCDQGLDGCAPYHMTIEAVDPVTLMRVARTYFLRSPHIPVFPRLAAVNANAAVTSGHMLFDVSEFEVCASASACVLTMY